MADVTLDRLFRQDAWATARMIAHLRSLPEATLSMTAPSTGWDVAVILAHILSGAESYAARIAGRPERGDPTPPDTHADLEQIAERAEAAWAELRAFAAENSDVEVVESDGGRTYRYPRSVVLAQAVYHSIEHRAQLFGVLTANGVPGMTLDDLDVWSYSEPESTSS